MSLPIGTELVGDYRIQRVLGAGGFGITYLAQEIPLERLVTIKEYFPSDFAVRQDGADARAKSQGSIEDYNWGLERFIEEAKALARFDHPNIVRVFRYFLANNTAYMVLQFEEGQSLKSWLNGLKRAPRQGELDAMLAPLLEALELIHGQNFLHRDIAPDNIIVRTDGSPVLIDFGSARRAMAQQSKTVSALVKPGYSPYEQYAEDARKQGPWTDIYSLGATLYLAITGQRPSDSPSRMVSDGLTPAREIALSSYRPQFLEAIEWALRLRIEERPQTVSVWRHMLLAGDAQPAPRAAGPVPGAIAARAAGPIDSAAPELPGRVEALKRRAGGLIDQLRQELKPDPRGIEARSPERPNGAAARPAATLALDAPEGRAEVTITTKPAPPPPPVPAAFAKNLPAKIEPAKPPVQRRRRSDRPRRAFNWDTRPLKKRLRSAFYKLLIGVAIAGAAVTYPEWGPRLPQIEATNTRVEPRTASKAAPTQPATESNPLLGMLQGHKGAANHVGYGQDGRQLVSTGADGLLRIWNAQSGKLVREIALDQGAASALAVQGKHALTGHHEGGIVLWDLERGERTSSFKRNEAGIWSLAFAGDNHRFVAAGHDWAVTLWDVRSSAGPIKVLDGHENSVQSIAFSPRGGLIASGGADKTIRLWDAASLEQGRTIRGHRDFVTALAISPDGSLIASGSLDRSVRIWSAEAGRNYRMFEGHRGKVASVAFSPDGQLVASGGEDGSVRLYDHRRRRTVRMLTGHIGAVTAVAFSPDGRRLASSGEDGTIRIWDASPPPRTARREE